MAKHAVNYCPGCQQYFEISKSYRAPWVQAGFGVEVFSPASRTGGSHHPPPPRQMALSCKCTSEGYGERSGPAPGVGLQVSCGYPPPPLAAPALPHVLQGLSHLHAHLHHPTAPSSEQVTQPWCFEAAKPRALKKPLRTCCHHLPPLQPWVPPAQLKANSIPQPWGNEEGEVQTKRQ